MSVTTWNGYRIGDARRATLEALCETFVPGIEAGSADLVEAGSADPVEAALMARGASEPPRRSA